MSTDAVSADAERVTVGVAKMELANAPGFVRRRHAYLEAKLDAQRVHRVDLFWRLEEPRHPHAARCLVKGKGGCVRPPRPLPAPAEEDLGVSAARTGEPGLTVLIPLERRLPSERLEPSEAAAHVGHVQDRPDGKHRQIAASLQRLDHPSPGPVLVNVPRIARAIGTTIGSVSAEGYESAERSYLDAVRGGAGPHELASAARRVWDSAREWEASAYEQFFAQRGTDGEAARAVIEKEIEAEKAELLRELWADIAAAHDATAG